MKFCNKIYFFILLFVLLTSLFAIDFFLKKRGILSFYQLTCKIEQKVRESQITPFIISNNLFFLRERCIDVLTSYNSETNNNSISQNIFFTKDMIFTELKKSFIDDSQWFRAGSDDYSNNYSSLNTINKTNIKNLSNIWNYKLGELDNSNLKNIETSPVFYDGILYFPDFENNLIALNIENGKILWKKKFPSNGFIARRGLSIDSYSKSILVPTNKGVFALNLSNGAINEAIGKKGVFGNSSSQLVSPIVDKEFIYFSETLDSSLLKYQKNNGKIVWRKSFKTSSNFDGALPWGGMSYDKDLNLIYIVTGNAKGKWDFLGTTRKGDNLFANSIVAVNTENGNIKWYFQDTKHDLWNHDVSFPPIISNIKYKNQLLRIVSVVGKSGNVYIFEGSSGKRLFEYKQTSTKESRLANEIVSRHQIVTTKPKRLYNLGIKKNQISNFDETGNNYLTNIYKNSVSEDFLPPEINKNLILNGISGGGQWFGGSVANNGVLYVAFNHIPWVINIVPKMLKTPYEFNVNSAGNKKYILHCASCHGNKADEYYNPITFSKDPVEATNKIFLANEKNNFTPSIIGSSIIKFEKDKNKYANFVKNKYKNISQVDLDDIVNYLYDRDKDLVGKKLIELIAFSDYFKDQYGNLGTKPPWSKLYAIDLISQEILWERPLGKIQVRTKEGALKKVEGSPAWSGIISTSSQLIFSASSFEPKLDIFDQKNGKLLHSIPLPFSASANPMTVAHNKKQYIVLMLANGGVRIDKGNIVSVFSLKPKIK
jgi:quinoprotein glucose dehydrogenase